MAAPKHPFLCTASWWHSLSHEPCGPCVAFKSQFSLTAVQMHYAPRQKDLPEWDVDEGEEPISRLTSYAREHRLLDDMSDFFDDDDAAVY